MTNYRPYKILLLAGLLMSLFQSAYAQFSTCDTATIYAHVGPNFHRLYVPNQPCSMYFYNPTPMYGIDAHITAANLGIPQLIINNAAENTDVLNALNAQNVFSFSFQVWMGMTDSATTFNWRTFTGAPLPTYTNWRTGEPNNQAAPCRFLNSCAFCTGADAYYCANGEDCAVLSNGGDWLDVTCKGTNLQRVCVLELNTCPVIIKPHDTTICTGNTVIANTGTLTGGTAPYSYHWSPGNLTGTSFSLSPATTTVYTIEDTDRYGCKTDSTYTITVTTNTPPTINNAPIRVCKGANDTISLSSVSATATYTWSFGAGYTVVSGSGGGPYVVNWSVGGTQNINVTISDGGCVSQPSGTVTVDSALAYFTLTPPGPVCLGHVVNDSTFRAGQTGPFVVTFGAGATVGGDGVGTYYLQWNSAGTRNITFRAYNHGCTDSLARSIVVSNPPIAFAGSDTSVCSGVSVQLGGVATAGVTYAWTPAANLNNANISDPVFSENNTNANPDTTRYMVVATVTGCADTAYVRVIVAPSPNISISALGSTVFCAGDSVVLTENAPTAVRYLWSNGDTTVNTTIKTNGNYTVTATDANGCQMVSNPAQSVTVNSNPTLALAVNGERDESCPNANDGKLTVVASNGRGAYTFTWSTTPVQHTDSAVGLAPGSYTVTVSDANGCIDTAIYSISAAVPMGIQIDSFFAPSCAGGIDGRAYVAAIGGSLPYSYSWADSIGGAAVGSSSSSLTAAPSGSYIVSVTDGRNCVVDTSVDIPASTIHMPLHIDSVFSPTCAGGNNGRAYVVALSGLSPYTYSWADSATGAVISSSTALTGVPAGSYMVSVTDANHCISDTSVDILRSTLIIFVQIDSMKNPSCLGTSNGAIYTSANGASLPISYLWSNGSTTASVTGLSADSFTVTITDANGCHADTTVALTAPPSFTVSASGSFHISYGSSQPLSVTVTPTAQNYNYAWSPAAGLSCADCAGPVAAPTVTTTYTVTVTEGTNGCRQTASIIVNVEALKHFYVPNAFTPNGDGVNDIHQVSYSGTIAYYEIRIYDRWGEMVYKSNDIDKGWDGSYLGVGVVPGEYTYQLAITFGDGQTMHNKGSITLVR